MFSTHEKLPPSQIPWQYPFYFLGREAPAEAVSAAAPESRKKVKAK